ncbi:agrin-like [Elysia marginata]|uniref:Agrin-like n=1 Tax=Elysia marginata TaxID=1093978 RepID=A0AAV4EPU5_9GAST|nr:agrin-like [Elysia marginata]
MVIYKPMAHWTKAIRGVVEELLPSRLVLSPRHSENKNYMYDFDKPSVSQLPSQNVLCTYACLHSEFSVSSGHVQSRTHGDTPGDTSPCKTTLSGSQQMQLLGKQTFPGFKSCAEFAFSNEYSYTDHNPSQIIHLPKPAKSQMTSTSSGEQTCPLVPPNRPAFYPSRVSRPPMTTPSSSFPSSSAHHISLSLLLAVLVFFTSSPFHATISPVTGCYVFPPGKTNPCTNQRCLYGAECMPSQDGKTARCQCPSECPNYGDSQGGGPVCGSNGVDYPNMCELRKESCTSMKNIRVKYYGKCVLVRFRFLLLLLVRFVVAVNSSKGSCSSIGSSSSSSSSSSRSSSSITRGGGLDSSVGRGLAPWPRGRGFEPQPSTVQAPTG